MYKLYFYVPESHLTSVKEALFAIGVGKIGHYDSCCWQTLGTGQYRPLTGSQPYQGNTDKVETLAEYKVEMVCDDHLIEQAIHTLKQAHPYESPAYGTWQLRDL